MPKTIIRKRLIFYNPILQPGPYLRKRHKQITPAHQYNMPGKMQSQSTGFEIGQAGNNVYKKE